MHKNQKDIVKIRAFRAVDDLLSCKKYADGHIDVLKSYNVPIVTSANTDWFYDPNVYVLLVETLAQNKAIGGTKIHVASDGITLPLEDALSETDKKISALVKRHQLKNTGELCGLWNSREAAGMGYSILLTEAGVAEAGIALAHRLKLSSLFVLCAPWTVKMVQNVGFTVEESVGNKGTFSYPKPDLLATLLIINDIETLTTANSDDRERIFDLRKTPKQTKIENGPKGQLRIEYDLFCGNNIK